MKYLMVIGLLLLGSHAYADDAVSIRGGWIHTATSNYSDGATGSARYEHLIAHDLWLGTEYEYHGATERTNGNDENPYVYGDVSGHSLLGLAIYRPTLDWLLKPYLYGGAGWSWWHFEPSEDTKARGIEVKLGDAFAYKVGAGLDYPLCHGWSVGVEIAFFKAHVPKEAHHADGSPSVLLGDDDRTGEVTIGQEEQTITLGVKHAW